MVNSASFHKYLFQLIGREVKQLHGLSGGDINQAFQIEFSSGAPLFLKTNPHVDRDFFQAEAEGLQSLSNTNTLLVPRIIEQGEFEAQQFLILEYFDEAEERDFDALGKGLATLHQCTQRDFGWEKDNYIGSLVQANAYLKDWSEFYAEYRILALSRKAFNAGLIDRADLKAIDSFLYRYPELLPQEKPALVHGDLWSGNVLYTKGGTPALIDPAVYYGHREMDIAMMQLFGGFPSAVFDSYTAHYPLEGDWQSRVKYQQLYPLLVHLVLFGPSYRSSCREVWKPFS